MDYNTNYNADYNTKENGILTFKDCPYEYVLTGEIGPDHDKKFVVSLVVGDKTLGEGTGRTKKAAEQEAAYRAIIKLKGNA